MTREQQADESADSIVAETARVTQKRGQTTTGTPSAPVAWPSYWVRRASERGQVNQKPRHRQARGDSRAENGQSHRLESASPDTSASAARPSSASPRGVPAKRSA
jgi:hypothetical protein